MRAVLWALGAIAVGLALFEVTMQPTAAERTQLAIIFVAIAGLGVLASILLPGLTERWPRLRISIAAVAVTSFAITATGLLVAANQMFVSSHDLTLLLVVLGFATVSAIGFAAAMSRPITADLERMAETASSVRSGDLTVRTAVGRRDEIGAVSRALDDMVEALEAADDQRERDDTARRRFLAAIGHDLRTPLASLQAAVEALSDGVAPDPDRYLNAMGNDVAALGRLIDDLFLLAKLDDGSVHIDPTTVDVTEITDEAIELLRPLAGRAGVNVELRAEQRVLVEGGAEALGRVLRNLIDNAVRYAPEGSTVVVSVEGDGGALVKVTDEGPGFDEAFLDEAFERFARADPARRRDTGGSGLGLAIARGFVEAMGGTIWAEPGPGGVVGFRLAGQGTTRTPLQKAT